MSKLGEPFLPRPPADADEYVTRLYRELINYLRQVQVQVNSVSEGRVTGAYNADSAVPTGVLASVGDFFRDSEPEESGTTGSMTVRLGWVAVVDGTASASSVVEVQALTGN